MRKFLVLLLALITWSFADVEVPRYDDGKIHRGLPSWIDMSDANTATFAAGGAVLALPETNHISYMSRTYSRLTIFNDGRISFGDLTNGLDRDIEPYLNPISVDVDWGATFLWKSYVDANSNYLTVVEMGPFQYKGRSYSVQASFYIDGEVQVQLWQNEAIFAKSEQSLWMLPVLYNGMLKVRPQKRRISRIDVYGTRGLRSGWIAKSFNGYGVQISEPDGVGNGLLVNMGVASDAGGVIADDSSREHPVVGGIANIEVKMKTPVNVDDSLCIWYFDEFGKTYLARYPSMKINQDFGRFSPNDYMYQWGGPFYQSPYVFRPAPAFKFQLAKPQHSNMQFEIESIIYNLKQLPSIQFLPPKPYRLSFSVVGNGRVMMNTPSGTSPFNLYEGERVSASIMSKAGTTIKQITVNGKPVVVDGILISKMKISALSLDLLRSLNEYAGLFKAYGKGPYTKMDFDIMSMHENIDVEIEFAPCEARELDVMPEMQKTTTYLDPADWAGARMSASASFRDGFGTVVQSQDSLASGKYIVSALYSDALGKVSFEPMSFVRDTTAFGYMDMACEACIVAANNYYDGSDSIDRPNALENAFTEFEPRYGNKAGSFGRSAGIAGASFEYGQRGAESYGLPASGNEDFLNVAYLNENGITDNFKRRIVNPGGMHLTISRDAEGRYAQSITDEKNRPVSTWMFDGENEFVVLNEYDGYDRITSTYPKGYPEFAETYTYDAMGRILSKNSKDRGLVEYAYDSLGNLRFVRNARQKAVGVDHFSANIYDGEGKVIAIGEVRGGHSFSAPNTEIAPASFTPVVRTLYGVPVFDSLVFYGVNLSNTLLQDILSQMDGVRDCDVGAVIAYDGEGNAVTIKMNSYDRIGRKSRQWVVYLFENVPAIQLSYGYNESDELVSSSFFEWNGNGWTQKSKRTRTYDNKGRLAETREGNAMLAAYEYSANGNVTEKRYYDAGAEVFTKTVRRDVYGRPVVLDYRNGSTELYSENISYENPLSVRQSTVSRVWNNAGSAGRIVENAGYTYDYLGRLTEMSGTRNASYHYDELGRLTAKHEGSQSVGYYYGSQNHQGYYRPYGMTISGRSYTPFEYYSYDVSGNVWLDRYANAAYELDSRALPERVRLYPEIPSAISQDNLDDYESSESGQVHMAYDESGQRVYYGFNGGDSEYGEATMSGVGVYRRGGVETPYSLSRQDLIAGGYRKDGSAYFPVTDVQGNIRGYANTSGVKSAYAYYPYGTLIDLAHDNAEDSKRWQSKEFDSDINKYYFGARFYDPLFGRWLTPDPAGQFANPYTYGGDPLNYIDPNGESVTAAIIVGAAVGAAIGGAVSAVNCSGANEVSCGQVITQGVVIGAASGAASGGVGSAVGGAIGGVGGAIISGAAGGATSGTVNYIGNAIVGNGSITDDGLWTAFWQGAVSGAISGGVDFGLSALGRSFGGSWANPATYFGNVPVLNSAVSSSVSSMVMAAINGDDVEYAGLSGLLMGGASSMLNSMASIGLVYAVYAIGDTEALNRLYGKNAGSWMTEEAAVAYAKEHPGTVMASVAEGGGIFIAILSGGGPFSHVRGSDGMGEVIETNGDGVMGYDDLEVDYQRNAKYKYDKHPNRLTFVTTKYAKGVSANSIKVAEMKTRKEKGALGWFRNKADYFGAGLCTGSVHTINNAYKGGAPNNLVPWQYRHVFYQGGIW